MYSEKTPDDGQRNCPKHVEFIPKIDLKKIVHLVAFIIRMYRDTGSPERQIEYIVVFRPNDHFSFVFFVLTKLKMIT